MTVAASSTDVEYAGSVWFGRGELLMIRIRLRLWWIRASRRSIIGEDGSGSFTVKLGEPAVG